MINHVGTHHDRQRKVDNGHELLYYGVSVDQGVKSIKFCVQWTV